MDHFSLAPRALADAIERRLEEFSLPKRCHVGNDDDKTGMDLGAVVEREEIGPVIRHKGVIALKNRIHQLPILGAALPEIVHMVSRMTGGMSQLNQRSMQALVNEEFRRPQAAARRAG